MPDRPPLPPFTRETALQKVQAAEDAWNTRDPRAGGAGLHRGLAVAEPGGVLHRPRRDRRLPDARKWQRELDYVLRKSLWAFTGDRIAVRFQYEWHDRSGQWFRSHGNENWEFDEHGLMRRREASINDVPITAAERRWTGPRGDDERGVEIPLR